MLSTGHVYVGESKDKSGDLKSGEKCSESHHRAWTITETADVERREH